MQLQAEGSGVINISLHKAGQGPAAHTLQPFTKGPLHFPPSSSPQSDPVWSLKCSLPDHWGKDLSSGESSNFDESWPSKSEESPGGGCGPSSVEAGPDHGEEGPVIVEQEDQLSKSESHESMLARYRDTPTLPCCTTCARHVDMLHGMCTACCTEVAQHVSM